jgi:oxygen-independent coproporphyrinogen III oxidase
MLLGNYSGLPILLPDDQNLTYKCDMTFDFQKIEMPEQLIRRFNTTGPRYTSYPTADRFNARFKTADYAHYLEQRAACSENPPLSVYVHVPFCSSLCYYCACNRIITKDHRRSTKYLRYVEMELDLLISHLRGRQQAVQVHLGGGTPTFLNPDELRQLMQMLRQNFDFSSDAEVSIELDPRTVDASMMALLAEMGFNRASLGVQDFDPEVQKAVHRIQPLEMVERTLIESRDAGFSSVSFDLIYGLPKQSVGSFRKTLDEVIRLAPDRIALYNYAHLPTRVMAQRRIAESDLPSAEERLQIFMMSMRGLLDAGYVYIGLDHFAKPQDELAKALANNSLHRNFQGYTTRAGCDLLGVGVSSISKIGDSYSQSVRTLEGYYDCLDAGELPVERGIALSSDDVVRRRVIMDLMCNTPVVFAAIDSEHDIDFATYFAQELVLLRPFHDDGLINVDSNSIQVLPKGRLFVRGVAMVFDHYLQQPAAGRFSRVI